MRTATASVVRLFGLLGLTVVVAHPTIRLSAQQPVAESLFAMATGPARVEELEVLAPLVFRDERLQAMVEELQRVSPTAAKMLLTIRLSGLPLELGTFMDVAEEMQHEYSSFDPERRSAAGFMAPVVREGQRFTGDLTTVKILVAVNLNMLDELFEGAEAVADAPVAWAEVRRLETLAVLAHELVHAYGLALYGGDPRVGCHDPSDDERPADSCVMIGENLLRREIGAPFDWEYGFPTVDKLVQRYSELEERRASVLGIADFGLPKVTVQPVNELPLRLESLLP